MPRAPPRKGSAKEAREAASDAAAPQSQRRSDRSGRQIDWQAHPSLAGRTRHRRASEGRPCRTRRGGVAPPLPASSAPPWRARRAAAAVLHRHLRRLHNDDGGCGGWCGRWAGVRGRRPRHGRIGPRLRRGPKRRRGHPAEGATPPPEPRARSRGAIHRSRPRQWRCSRSALAAARVSARTRRAARGSLPAWPPGTREVHARSRRRPRRRGRRRGRRLLRRGSHCCRPLRRQWKPGGSTRRRPLRVSAAFQTPSPCASLRACCCLHRPPRRRRAATCLRHRLQPPPLRRCPQRTPHAPSRLPGRAFGFARSGS